MSIYIFEPIIDNTMPLNQNYKQKNKIREVSPIPVETACTTGIRFGDTQPDGSVIGNLVYAGALTVR